MLSIANFNATSKSHVFQQYMEEKGQLEKELKKSLHGLY